MVQFDNGPLSGGTEFVNPTSIIRADFPAEVPRAFADLHVTASIVLTVAVFVFAYSTLISWGYHGERATEYLFGRKAITPFRVAFIIATMFGPTLSLKNVIDFSDLMLLSMAFPNIIGMVFLAG